jgi:hypothetical protein
MKILNVKLLVALALFGNLSLTQVNAVPGAAPNTVPVPNSLNLSLIQAAGKKILLEDAVNLQEAGVVGDSTAQTSTCVNDCLHYTDYSGQNPMYNQDQCEHMCRAKSTFQPTIYTVD